MAKPKTITKVMGLLSAAYPNYDMPEATPELYLKLLADIPDDVLETATLDHISKSPFYPKISELRAAAASLATGANRFPSAYEAWQEVDTAIKRYGRDRKPEFNNPILERTVAALGWRNLCLSTNQVADRARFVEAYNQFLRRAMDDAVTLPQVRDLAAKLSPGQPAGLLLPAETDPESESEDLGSMLDRTGERESVFDTGERRRRRSA